jgi:predicted phosphoribosyltransferase
MATRASSWDDANDELGLTPCFADRRAGGRALARALGDRRDPATVVVGLARGGVATAAEVARALGAPLDVVAVRKLGHPWQPEYALGAVTPGAGIFMRAADGLTRAELAAIVERARAEAAALDRRLHAVHPALDLRGATALVVDDGVATGATMIAALRWARAAGASRVVAAAPVAAIASLARLRREADEVVCPYAPERFRAVGAHYASFPPVGEDAVIRLVAENRREQLAPVTRGTGGARTGRT